MLYLYNKEYDGHSTYGYYVLEITSDSLERVNSIEVARELKQKKGKEEEEEKERLRIRSSSVRWEIG